MIKTGLEELYTLAQNLEGLGVDGWSIYHKVEDEMRPLIEDGKRIDFLENMSKDGFEWVARDSTTGRGFRLHQSPDYEISQSKNLLNNKPSSHSVRIALDKAMKE